MNDVKLPETIGEYPNNSIEYPFQDIPLKTHLNIGYHIIWCPKYRRRVLTGNVEQRLKELLHVL